MNKPYSIKIFVTSGDPDGIRTIEKSNWNGSGVVFPRTLISDAKAREELNRTGVYILMDPPQETGLPTIYVGEGDPVKPRLEQHIVKKDFWQTCIAFTSKDSSLNKAHVQYIESSLIKLAKNAKRCELDNGNTPELPSLSESDSADAKGFLAEILLCLPILGVSVFQLAKPISKGAQHLFIVSKGIKAEGMETHDGFMVYAGSKAVSDEVPSCHTYIRELRAALIKNGVLKPNDHHLVFSQDYVFASPSTAAGVIQGRSANGRIEWKTNEGKTLKAIQESISKA